MLSDVVGERITTWRKRRGWTRDQLAAQCAELGMPKLSSESLANIETGRRQGGVRRRLIAIDELVVIACALDLPLIALLVPYPDDEEMEIRPGTTVRTEQALTWILDMTFPTWIYGTAEDRSVNPTERLEYWKRSVIPIRNYQSHEDLVHRAAEIRTKRLAPAQRDAEAASVAADVTQADLNQLRTELTEASETGREEDRARLQTLAETQMMHARAAAAMRDAATATAELAVREFQNVERNLVGLRDKMRAAGQRTPTLPNTLAHLNDVTMAEYSRGDFGNFVNVSVDSNGNETFTRRGSLSHLSFDPEGNR